MARSFRLLIAAAKGEFEEAFTRMAQPMEEAATAAMKEARTYVVTRGRAAIAEGGLSKKWQNALRGNVYPKKGASLEPATWIYHKIPYAGIFNRGGVIQGKPLLWLPLASAPQKIGGKRMTPKNYQAQVGDLFSVNRPGKPPLLFGYMRGRPGSKATLSKLRAGSALSRLGVRQGQRSERGGAGVVAVPLFIGIAAVTLRQRFNLTPILEQASKNLAEWYFQHLRRS